MTLLGEALIPRKSNADVVVVALRGLFSCRGGIELKGRKGRELRQKCPLNSLYFGYCSGPNTKVPKWHLQARAAFLDVETGTSIFCRF